MKGGTMEKITVKNLIKILGTVENQNAPIAYFTDGKLLFLIGVHEAVDGSVVTLGFCGEEEYAKQSERS